MKTKNVRDNRSVDHDRLRDGSSTLKNITHIFHHTNFEAHTSKDTNLKRC